MSFTQTTTTIAKLLDGKLRLETRNRSPRIYARTYLGGKNLVYNTQSDDRREAEAKATEWYLDLRHRLKHGERLDGPTFGDVATKFLKIARRDHSDSTVRNHEDKDTLLRPLMGHVKITAIDKKFLIDLRDQRSRSLTKGGRCVTNNTLKKDFHFIRAVLKFAKDEEKVITTLPGFPAFTGPRWAVHPQPRRYFEPAEFRRLLWAAARRTLEAKWNVTGQDLNSPKIPITFVVANGDLLYDGSRRP